MTIRIFVDTNVLIYARDRRDARKRQLAREWLGTLGAAQAGVLNLQVLNEFTRWVLRNEPRRPLDEVRAEVDALRAWGDQPVHSDDVEFAWAARARLGFQWFDCLLLGAAERAECSYFLTDDMSEGATFASVTVVHPFNTAPGAILFRD